MLCYRCIVGVRLLQEKTTDQHQPVLVDVWHANDAQIFVIHLVRHRLKIPDQQFLVWIVTAKIHHLVRESDHVVRYHHSKWIWHFICLDHVLVRAYGELHVIIMHVVQHEFTFADRFVFDVKVYVLLQHRLQHLHGVMHNIKH